MLLSTAEAAERLGLSSSTLARWRRLGNGPLPWIAVGKAAVRYDPADIQAHIAARRRVPAKYAEPSAQGA